MLLKVKVIPNSSVNKIIERKENFLKIKLTAPAVEDKANQAFIKFLAKEFNTVKSNIQIIKGLRSKEKIIKIK